MIAKELGERRQASAGVPPDGQPRACGPRRAHFAGLGDPVVQRLDPGRHRQDPALAADAQLFVRALQWCFLPYLWYLVLRSFISALEKPLWSFVVGVVAVLFNAIVNYGLIFGHLGFPRLGLVGAGIGSALANTIMFVGMALVVLMHRRFRRFRLFGHFWRSDWQRFREVWRLGLPIAVTLALEITYSTPRYS